MNGRSTMKGATTALAVALVSAALPGHALGAVDLGSAQSFAVLGGTTVTNTGLTVVTGDLGIWPNNALTGFPPGIVVGNTHLGDGIAQQAQGDTVTAYNALAAMPFTQDLTGQDLGGLTLTPGVYFFASSAFLTTSLTLDAQGDPDAEFVFQMGSTLVTSSGSSVVTINGADGCNVFWQTGSSATLGTNSDFTGSILALTSITLTTDASIIDGRALAINGAVTMDTNVVDACRCIPAPGAMLLLGPVLAGSLVSRRRTV